MLRAGFALLLSKEEAALFFAIPDLVLSLILFALWLPIEAALHLRDGGDPAKWLFGIRVEGGRRPAPPVRSRRGESPPGLGPGVGRGFRSSR